MKKTIIFLAVLFIGITALPAQTIADVFKDIPKDILYGISDADKALLVNNEKDSIGTIVPGSIYVGIERLALSDDFVSFSTSEVATTQVKILSLINDSKIICVVKTVCGEKMCDSDVRFYTTDWNAIETGNLLPHFDPNWFLKKDTNEETQAYKNAIAALDINPYKVELSPSDDDMKIYYDVDKYLSKEDAETLRPYLNKEPKVLTWNKVSFQ